MTTLLEWHFRLKSHISMCRSTRYDDSIRVALEPSSVLAAGWMDQEGNTEHKGAKYTQIHTVEETKAAPHSEGAPPSLRFPATKLQVHPTMRRRADLPIPYPAATTRLSKIYITRRFPSNHKLHMLLKKKKKKKTTNSTCKSKSTHPQTHAAASKPTQPAGVKVHERKGSRCAVRVTYLAFSSCGPTHVRYALLSGVMSDLSIHQLRGCI